MTKKIPITTRAKKKTKADEWLEEGTAKSSAPPGPTKRLTADMDLDLHKALKMYCAQHDRQIADLIRHLIAREIGYASTS